MYKTKKACINRKLELDKHKFLSKNNIQDNYESGLDFIKKNYSEPLINKKKSSTKNSFDDMLDRKFKNSYYQNINLESIENTYTYMFKRHRKGIYISIRNNKLKVFMQFNNKRFINPLSKYLKLHPDAKNQILEYHKRHPEDIPKKIDNITFKPSHTWMNINCLLSNIINQQYPSKIGYETEPYIQEIQKFLELLCKNRKVADCDFFINKLDQIILERTLIIPFWNIVNNQKIPIKNFRNNNQNPQNNKNFCPILSFSSNHTFLDIPFILPDDIHTLYKSYWQPKCGDRLIDHKINTAWDTKNDTLVFRGAATGCGFTVENNPRIALVYYANEWSKNPKYKNMFNVALTGKDAFRYKKHCTEKYIRYYFENRVEQNPENTLSLAEQSNYKYQIYIEGNVAAYRISSMLAVNSLIIYLESDYTFWYSHLLVHKENCIKIKNIKELPNVITWCRNNDEKCKIISQNGFDLHNTYLKKKGLLDYASNVFKKINNNYIIN
jgi:hypothetical protein